MAESIMVKKEHEETDEFIRSAIRKFNTESCENRLRKRQHDIHDRESDSGRTMSDSLNQCARCGKIIVLRHTNDYVSAWSFLLRYSSVLT